jgi:uncharacterized membrane protein
MCVAFIPFPTALLAEYIQSEESTATVATYSRTLAVTASFFTLLWLYAVRNYRLVDRNLDPALLRAMTRRYVIGMVLYVVAYALAFANVVLSLALVFILLEPGSRPRSEDDRNAKKPNKT